MAAEADAGRLGHIREVQRAAPVGRDLEIVAKQAARRMGRTDLPARLERSALHEEDVEVAVRVVVEERRAGAHLLGHVVLAGRAADVCKRQPRLVRPIR